MTLEQWAWVYYAAWFVWLFAAWQVVKGAEVSLLILAASFVVFAGTSVWFAIATGQYAFIALLVTLVVFSVAFTREAEDADSES